VRPVRPLDQRCGQRCTHCGVQPRISFTRLSIPDVMSLGDPDRQRSASWPLVAGTPLTW
jgi:hypothetical protein